MSEDIFEDNSNPNTPVIDPEKDYFSEFVGDGKKYKDTKAAGRALLEKDLFIEKLKQEAEEARQELRSRLSVEEALTKLQTQPKSNDTGQAYQASQGGSGANDGGGNSPDIDKLVEEKLLAREKQQKEASLKAQQEANLQEVRQKLEGTFGPNYAKAVKEKAAELGVSTEFLTETGARMPSALYKLLDIGTQAPRRDISDPAPVRSSINTSGMTNPGNVDRTMSYYENLRKSDPKRYFTADVQAQKHKDAIRLREKFFDV